MRRLALEHRLPCCAGFSLADQGSQSHPRGDFARYRALFSVSCAHPKKATTFLFISNKIRRLQSIAIASLRHYHFSLRLLPTGSFRKLTAGAKATELASMREGATFWQVTHEG